MADPLLLDTCACLWLTHGDPMSPASREAVRQAQQGAGVHVSPITAWEVATLVAKDRYRLTVATADWFDRLVALPGVRLAPMPPEVLIDSASLPDRPPPDPADRIIVATALRYGHAIVTRDRTLVAYGPKGGVSIIVC